MLDRCSSHYIGFQSTSVLPVPTKLLYWHINLAQPQHHCTSHPSYNLWHLCVCCGLSSSTSLVHSYWVWQVGLLCGGTNSVRLVRTLVLYHHKLRSIQHRRTSRPTVWNALPNNQRLSNSLPTFKKHLKSLLFNTACHIVESCPLTKLNGGLSRLHSADEDAVSWLTNYGKWHAYEKKNTALHMTVSLQCLCIFTTLWRYINLIFIIIIIKRLTLL